MSPKDFDNQPTVAAVPRMPSPLRGEGQGEGFSALWLSEKSSADAHTLAVAAEAPPSPGLRPPSPRWAEGRSVGGRCSGGLGTVVEREISRQRPQPSFVDPRLNSAPRVLPFLHARVRRRMMARP
jgi:hypothetical protein